MARSVLDCIHMMGALTAPTVREHDVHIPHYKPFDQAACLRYHKTKLKVGYMETDGFFESCESVKRAVREAAQALREAGHEVVPFTMPLPAEEYFITYCALLAADGNWHGFMEALEGEELSENYKQLHMYTNMPNFIRPILGKFLSWYGEERKAKMLTTLKNGGYHVREYWDHIGDFHDKIKAWDVAFKAQGLDALILPTVALPAPKHHTIAEMLPCIANSMLMNFLHWPAGSVPVTTVGDGEDRYYSDAELPPGQRDSFAKLASACMEGSKGLPVGVQVAAPRWEDERCLCLMRQIEDKVKFSARPAVI
jgi:Asp-tRNA(Asn)/Glu-tRNA(Gln) amidotransferase A subunit family amidase